MTCRLTALALAVLAIPQHLQAQEDAFVLEGLVVTGSATPRPADALSTHVTVLEGMKLRRAGLTRIQDALRSVAGVAVVENGSYGATSSLFMRGAESDHVLVLVDGVQVNQPGGSFDWAALTLDNVERIEVVRGPASALYGSDAVAGVIHVITRAGGGDGGGALSLAAGGYGTLEVSAGLHGGGDRAGYSATLSRRRTDGILPLNNQSSNTVLSLAGRFTQGDDTRVRASVRLADRAYHFPTDGSGAATDENAFTFGDESVLGLTVDRRATDRLGMSLTLGVSELDGGTDDAPDAPSDTLGFFGFTSLDHVRRASVDVRGNLDLGGATLTVGGEVEEERQRSFTSSLSQFGPSADETENTRWNRAAYGHVTGEKGRLAFNAGGRLEDNERFGVLATWQLGARVRIAAVAGLSIRASLGRGIKEPTFYENFATGFAVGNPTLDPERSRSWELGADQSVWGGRGRLSVTHFRQRLEDLIQYTFAPADPGGSNFYNVAAADAHGTEVAAQVTGGRGSLSASLTRLKTRVVDAGFDEGPGAGFVEGEALLRRPSHTAAVSASLALGAHGSVAVTARRVGERADRDFSAYPAERVVLPAHMVAGVSTTVPLSGVTGMDGVTLTFGADNLLDEAYEEVLGFAAPGRRFLLGFRVELGG